MSVIRIGCDERQVSEADAHWVTYSINARRAEGLDVCVIVNVRADQLDLTLVTPACAVGRGGQRRPSEREVRVLELWNQHGLNSSNWGAGGVVAFLAQLKRFL